MLMLMCPILKKRDKQLVQHKWPEQTQGLKDYRFLAYCCNKKHMFVHVATLATLV